MATIFEEWGERGRGGTIAVRCSKARPGKVAEVAPLADMPRGYIKGAGVILHLVKLFYRAESATRGDVEVRTEKLNADE